jgi:hypothetical protein
MSGQRAVEKFFGETLYRILDNNRTNSRAIETKMPNESIYARLSLEEFDADRNLGFITVCTKQAGVIEKRKVTLEESNLGMEFHLGNIFCFELSEVLGLPIFRNLQVIEGPY